MTLKHHKGCASNYPEKPEGERPQAIEIVTLEPGVEAHQCVDCGAFEIVEVEKK